MVTTEKAESKYTPPSFIDKKIIKKLSKDKQSYWENRLLGKPGQDNQPELVVKSSSSEVTTSFDNAGKIVVHNRQARRNRPPKLNIFTKATHSIKKERLRNEKQRRNRAVAKARKTRRASYSQVA